MNQRSRGASRRTVSGLALFACGWQALAQGVATDTQLPAVLVTAQAARSGLAAPSSSASRTAAELRQQNLVNPEDALQYVPGTTMRKRYIGDRNALMGGRSFGTLQPSRALVYVDGYLISNFLGRFDAPRWNMVSPEAIERVDVLYGPYSALFPGNSIGTTVALTQRVPRGFEASARVTGYRQRFSQYGSGGDYDGHQLSARVGHRLPSGLWFTADVNHQNSTSQPMQYFARSANAAGAFPTVVGSATTVSGIVYDTDPKGLRRAVFGASGGAIDHTLQDTLNLRAGYRLTSELEASMQAAWWRNQTQTRNQSFLRDATGATVWQGVVSDGIDRFSIPASAFAPSLRDERHRQLGATLKTRRKAGWNMSLVVSDYRILDDRDRQADNPEPIAAIGGAGSVTRRGGTGWNTMELQATWAPAAGDWTGGRHALAFGLHRNDYRLDNTVEAVSALGDWRRDGGTLSQFYRGRTEVLAAYVQDAWRLHDDWTFTLGWREERFRTFEGSQFGDGFTQAYAARRLAGRSPKLALVWHVSDDLLLRLSAGRGVRFPNVEELYNGTVTSTSQTLSDPNLQAETSDALEWSAEQQWASHRLRVSLFHDDVKDAILRQSTTDPTVCQASSVTATSYACVQNVDRVKTTGIELAWQAQDLFLRGLDLDASAAYTARSKVVANRRDPAMVGKWWLRVPRVRATLQASYRPDEHWMFSAGWRHQGRAHGDTYNLDVNPDVYGGISSFDSVDLRASRKLTPTLELALGVDNVGDTRAYQAHPYPGRTLFTELRASH